MTLLAPLPARQRVSARGPLTSAGPPLRAGKVHGSLARAGKVRGQTPKEMLGTIAQSDLVRSVTISAASICGLLLAMSVIAYGIRDEEAANPKKKDADKPPAKAATPNPATPPPATAQPGTPPDPLGVNQEKKGTPKESNPFDTEGDLLKDK